VGPERTSQVSSRQLSQIQLVPVVVIHDQRAPAMSGLPFQSLERSAEPVPALLDARQVPGYETLERLDVWVLGTNGSKVAVLVPEHRSLQLVLGHPSQLPRGGPAQQKQRESRQDENN
jgi:hypothetical protein